MPCRVCHTPSGKICEKTHLLFVGGWLRWCSLAFVLKRRGGRDVRTRRDVLSQHITPFFLRSDLLLIRTHVTRSCVIRRSAHLVYAMVSSTMRCRAYWGENGIYPLASSGVRLRYNKQPHMSHGQVDVSGDFEATLIKRHGNHTLS